MNGGNDGTRTGGLSRSDYETSFARALHPGTGIACREFASSHVHKLIGRRLIRPRLRRIGRFLHRMLTREQLLYLRLEAKGVRTAADSRASLHRQKIEKWPEIDVMCLTEDSALIIEVKSTRSRSGLKKLQRGTTSQCEVVGSSEETKSAMALQNSKSEAGFSKSNTDPLSSKPTALRDCAERFRGWVDAARLEEMARNVYRNDWQLLPWRLVGITSLLPPENLQCGIGHSR